MIRQIEPESVLKGHFTIYTVFPLHATKTIIRVRRGKQDIPPIPRMNKLPEALTCFLLFYCLTSVQNV